MAEVDDGNKKLGTSIQLATFLHSHSIVKMLEIQVIDPRAEELATHSKSARFCGISRILLVAAASSKACTSLQFCFHSPE